MLPALLARWLSRVIAAIAEPPQPRLMRGGLGRACVLVGVLALLGLAPIHLSPGWTRVAGWLVLAVVVLVAATTVAGFNNLVHRIGARDPPQLIGGRVRIPLPRLEREIRVFDAWMGVLRSVGLALPALVFFCSWAAVYAIVWAHAPAACKPDPALVCHGAFQGLEAHPTYGDFLYMAVNLAFANPPPDIIAHSRLAHEAATLEVITGVALVTLYAGSFFGIGTSAPAVSAPADAPPR